MEAGDRVAKGQVLARLSSPELENDYKRERTTLESMDAPLKQERIDLQQQLLTNQEQANLAAVTMNARLRSLRRAKAARKLHVISEHNHESAYDSFSIARLSFEHARQNVGLERERVLLDLRNRELKRKAQALLVAGLEQRLEKLTVRSPVSGLWRRSANLTRCAWRGTRHSSH